MSIKVDLNCDMGESFGAYKLGYDEEAVKYITSANVACGFHAGDPQVMYNTVEMAAAHGVAVGAHPSYPDLLGFGRRNLEATPEEIRNYVIYQVGALQAFTRAHGLQLQHVKAHGSLYNMAAVDRKVALALAQGIYHVDRNLLFLVLPDSEMEKAAVDMGLRYACEVFGDRNYNADGTLVSRKHPQAVITDSEEVAKRVVDMVKERRIRALDGSTFPVRVDSICLHGDTPGAIQHMRHLREALERAQIIIKPMGSFIR